MLRLALSCLLFTLLLGIPGWSGPSGDVFGQFPRGSIVIPDTSVPPPPSISANPTPPACMEAERLFHQQQAYQQVIFPLLGNIHQVVATLDAGRLEQITRQMEELENLSAHLMQSLEQCQQQARPEATISPCEQIPLLESAIQSAMEVNRDERLRRMAEARMGNYIYNYNQIQIRVPQPGTIVNLGQVLPQVDPGNLPDPGLNPQDSQIQNLFRQLHQARMECLQSRTSPRVP